MKKYRPLIQENTYCDENDTPYLFERFVDGVLTEKHANSENKKQCIITRFKKKTGAFQEKIWTDPKWFGMTAPVYEYDASAHQASKQMGGANATDERKKRAMPDDIIRAARNAVAIVYGGSTEGASETEETKDAPEMKRT